MTANDRLDEIEARINEPRSMAYGLTHYYEDVPALVAALRAVLDIGPYLRNEYMGPQEIRLADGWDSAVHAAHREISAALDGAS